MKLFVGLGNPGQGYARNRHNIGFMAVDRIAAAHGFAPWRARFQGEASEGRLGAERVVLLKPATFMNLSGQSAGEALRFFKLEAGDVTVFHDELDLPPGKVRLKSGGGHGGHNGLRSLHQHIGEAYHRVRLGIGHPGHKDRVTPHVLGDFVAAEQGWLEDLLAGIARGAVALAAGEGSKFQQALGGPPPSASAPASPPPARRGPEAPWAAGSGDRARRAAAERVAKVMESAPDSPLARLLKQFGKDPS